MNHLLLTSLLCVASVAVAQDSQGARPSLPPLAEVPPAMDPAPRPAPPVATARERRSGTVGLGYLGLAAVTPPSPVSGLGGLIGIFRVQVPMLGGRWWFRGSPLGLDLGLGAMASTRSDFISPNFQVVAHVGLPIAVASTQHVIVLLAPEFRAGFSILTDSGTGATASLLELALRGGVELFFGFIGVSELSLEASVRVGVAREAQTVSFSRFGGGSSSENYRFSTSLAGDGASIIASTLSLRYYF